MIVPLIKLVDFRQHNLWARRSQEFSRTIRQIRQSPVVPHLREPRDQPRLQSIYPSYEEIRRPPAAEANLFIPSERTVDPIYPLQAGRDRAVARKPHKDGTRFCPRHRRLVRQLYYRPRRPLCYAYPKAPTNNSASSRSAVSVQLPMGRGEPVVCWRGGHLKCQSLQHVDFPQRQVDALLYWYCVSNSCDHGSHRTSGPKARATSRIAATVARVRELASRRAGEACGSAQLVRHSTKGASRARTASRLMRILFGSCVLMGQCVVPGALRA